MFLGCQEFIAKAIALPGEGEIMDMMAIADPDSVHAVRTFIRKELAVQLRSELLVTVISYSLTIFMHLIWVFNEQLNLAMFLWWLVI